jgi:hypothetical protein
VGSAQKTVDASYDEEKKKFEDTYKLVKKLNKDAHRVLELLKGIRGTLFSFNVCRVGCCGIRNFWRLHKDLCGRRTDGARCCKKFRSLQSFG